MTLKNPEQQEISRKESEISYQRHLMEEARKFLDSVGDDIEKSEIHGDSELVYPSGHGYSGEKSLTFFDPNQDHAKMIIKELTDAGYKAEIVTKEVGNIEYQFYGDGEYNVVSVHGTHNEYQLKINW